MGNGIINKGDWMIANDPELMKIYRKDYPEVWNEMMRQTREYPPKVCCECFFYYHLRDQDGTIYGGGCTADPDIMIMDMNKKAEDCPL